MKPFTSPSRLLKSLTTVTLAIAALAGTAAATVPGLPLFYYTGIDLGAAGWNYNGNVRQWAVFSLNNGISATATTASVGTPTIVGDVGTNGGNISLSGNAYLFSHAHIRTGNTLVRAGLSRLDGSNTVSPTQTPFGPTPLTGRALNVIEPQNVASDLLVNQVFIDATAASTAAAAKSTFFVGASATGFSLGSGVINLSVMDGILTAPGAKVVLNLTDFIITAGRTFEIVGNQFTSLVINVSNTFSLINGNVKLTGVLGGNVIFNVVGSGSNVNVNANSVVGVTATPNDLNDQNAAIILAPGRQVIVGSGSLVRGTLIARGVSISGNSRVIKPTWASP